MWHGNRKYSGRVSPEHSSGRSSHGLRLHSLRRYKNLFTWVSRALEPVMRSRDAMPSGLQRAFHCSNTSLQFPCHLQENSLRDWSPKRQLTRFPFFWFLRGAAASGPNISRITAMLGRNKWGASSWYCQDVLGHRVFRPVISFCLRTAYIAAAVKSSFAGICRWPVRAN